LARIGREALDVTALALGVDRIERERGLARPRQAGQHHQPVARQLDVDVLEIVLARPANRDHAGVGTAAVLVEEIVHGDPERSENTPPSPARFPHNPALSLLGLWMSGSHARNVIENRRTRAEPMAGSAISLSAHIARRTREVCMQSL